MRVVFCVFLLCLRLSCSWRVTKPALRTIGNIVCAEDDTDYTQHIIDAGAVPCLQQLIAHSNREIQKEVHASSSIAFLLRCFVDVRNGVIVLCVLIVFSSRTASSIRIQDALLQLNALLQHAFVYPPGFVKGDVLVSP